MVEIRYEDYEVISSSVSLVIDCEIRRDEPGRNKLSWNGEVVQISNLRHWALEWGSGLYIDEGSLFGEIIQEAIQP